MLQDYVKAFKNVWGVGVLVASTGPLALAVPELTPPWPTSSARIATIFCAIAAVLALIWGRELAALKSSSTRKRRFIFGIASCCLFLGLVCSLFYLDGYSKYVVVVTQPALQHERHLRFIVGTEMLETARSSRSSREDLLQEYMYEPERIWTLESLRHARLLLFGSFVLTFSTLTFGLGLLAITVGQSRGKSPP